MATSEKFFALIPATAEEAEHSPVLTFQKNLYSIVGEAYDAIGLGDKLARLRDTTGVVFAKGQVYRDTKKNTQNGINNTVASELSPVSDIEQRNVISYMNVIINRTRATTQNAVSSVS